MKPQHKLFAILALLSACSLGWISQSQITCEVRTNAGAAATNGVSTAGYFLRIVAKIPAELDAVTVSFVDVVDGCTFLQTTLAGSIVASGFGDANVNGLYRATGSLNGQPLYTEPGHPDYAIRYGQWGSWYSVAYNFGGGNWGDQYDADIHGTSPHGTYTSTQDGTWPGGTVSRLNSEATVLVMETNLIHGSYSIITSTASATTNTTAIQLLILEER